MFKKILIANRGEIACRVIRTAKRLGIQTVAVYSDVDANALHVALADEAYYIGRADPQQSYLNIANIIAAARLANAEAIHPGYGFLSENAEFCRACDENNVVFIGPTVAAIEAMGSKARAKQLMEQAGVPLVPGYQGQDQSDATLLDQAQRIGLPLLIKASAGGGGKGMRLVSKLEDFEKALLSARREAQQSFADDRVILEKYLVNTRHVEVQVFCDQQGRGIYLGDRDCSMQRRHQKILEEAPAPGLSRELRQAMGEAAVRAALAIDYRGAGTIEFLLDEFVQDKKQQFYFMEMNTRLQVEHPVSELISGQDLVEWQLRVAAGQNLPLTQEEVQLNGHAIEARVYAEDCDNGFIPSSGKINYLRWPEQNEKLRIDTGVREGDEISAHYDPMIAKVIVWDEDRNGALRQLENALQYCCISGLKTNLPFLSLLQASNAFQQKQFHTAYVDDHIDELQVARPVTSHLLALAGLTFWLNRKKAAQSSGTCSPWSLVDSWRMNLPRSQSLSLYFDGSIETVYVSEVENVGAENIAVTVAEKTCRMTAALNADQLTVVSEGRQQRYFVDVDNDYLNLFVGNRAFQFELWSGKSGSQLDNAQDSSVCAPMHGRLIELLVAEGQQLQEGEAVAVVEAMKMEHTLRAPHAGKVVQIFHQVNDIVENGAAIVELA